MHLISSWIEVQTELKDENELLPYIVIVCSVGLREIMEWRQTRVPRKQDSSLCCELSHTMLPCWTAFGQIDIRYVHFIIIDILTDGLDTKCHRPLFGNGMHKYARAVEFYLPYVECQLPMGSKHQREKVSQLS